MARHGESAAADLARDADGAVFAATHHQAQRFRVPLYWPHGIPGPDAGRFARDLLAANPSVHGLVRAHPPLPDAAGWPA